MSTRVGTLKPSRERSIWPAAVAVSIVMLTVAVIALSLDRGSAAPTTSKVGAQAVAIATGTAANTPSELRAVTSAERVGAGISFVRHVPRRGIGTSATEAPTQSIGANTPIEISGGIPKTSQAEIWAREHVRRG